MAEIRLDQQVHHQLGSLLGRLAQEPELRTRLEEDPIAVFAEFGLSTLLPEAEGLQVKVVEQDVSGFAQASPPIHADSHFDDHTDHTNVALRGIGISILPAIGPRTTGR